MEQRLDPKELARIVGDVFEVEAELLGLDELERQAELLVTGKAKTSVVKMEGEDQINLVQALQVVREALSVSADLLAVYLGVRGIKDARALLAGRDKTPTAVVPAEPRVIEHQEAIAARVLKTQPSE